MKEYEYDGDFSKDLLCLKLQFETLFESVSGDICLDFLDLISKLAIQEREIILKQFSNIVKTLLANTERKKTLEDLANQKFEDELYNGIEEEFNNIQTNPLTPQITQSRFKVINGGKNRAKNKIIKFNKALVQ